ncbi:MAG TPA: hypothetical protein VLB84_17570 [Bacteroidia bacterium]|nr:hypothetical protein [Bacteroidia bacterium]
MAPTNILINDDFDINDVCVGSIIWYTDTGFDSDEWHPHAVIAIDNKICYTVCGTSQKETIQRKARHLNLADYSCFPLVSPTLTNKLSKDTFFDCLDYFEIHLYDLEDKFESGEGVKVSGKITYSDYTQIRNALRSSPTLDIEDLLVHPDDDL